MDDDHRVEDVLGFTRQTEMLLTGIGAPPDVIKEFRKRNLSSDELSQLTEFDLVKLGITQFLYFSNFCFLFVEFY